MSAMGRASKIEGVLTKKFPHNLYDECYDDRENPAKLTNKTLDAGPLLPVNKLNKFKYYCPNCYSFEVYYRQVETGVFDITCLSCHKHWYKTCKFTKNMPKNT